MHLGDVAIALLPGAYSTIPMYPNARASKWILETRNKVSIGDAVGAHPLVNFSLLFGKPG